MAKGTLHLNVELSAVADEEGKFGRLASLLGLADADHARGKCEHLWVACTRRGEADLPQWLVEQVLGERGPAALVEAELASWGRGRGDSKTRRLRIGGAQKHCLWMAIDQEEKSEQRRKGGKSRESTASRQLDGTFAPAGDAHPAERPPQSSSSEISSASEIFPEDRNFLSRAIPQVVQEQQHPAGGAGAAPSVHAVSPPAPVREDIAGTQPGVSRSAADRPGQTENGQNRPFRPQPVGDRDPKPANAILPFDPTDPFARGRLAEAMWRRVSDARIAIAVELGLPAPLPFPPITPGSYRAGFRDLRARIDEEGALAPTSCDRVLENAVKMARTKRSTDWLGERLFGDKAWTNARDGVDPSARSAPSQRAGPQPAPPRPRDRDPPPKAIPRDQLAGPEQFAEARDLLAKAVTSNDDDTPPERKPRKAKTA